MKPQIDGESPTPTYPWQALRTRKAWLIAVLLVALLAGWMWHREQNRTYGVGIVGYNHTSDGIDFYVNGSMGGNIAPHGGGGSHACCVSMPAHYKPGMTVRVLWKATIESPDGNAFKQRDVPVDPYEVLATVINVHFLKDGSIKVLSTPLTAMHPDYPIKDTF